MRRTKRITSILRQKVFGRDSSVTPNPAVGIGDIAVEVATSALTVIRLADRSFLRQVHIFVFLQTVWEPAKINLQHASAGARGYGTRADAK